MYLRKYIKHPGDMFSKSPQWRNVVHKTYSHKAYCFRAEDKCRSSYIEFFHLNHWLFGNSLVSTPFADVGGFVSNQADDLDQKLLTEAIKVASRLCIPSVELRLNRPLEWLNQDYLADIGRNLPNARMEPSFSVKTHKTRMVLELPDSTDTLMKSFKSKLRSQIRRPIKDGMCTVVGKKELIDDFYHIFRINMRDLGSPVHSIKLFESVLSEFRHTSDFILVYKKKTPVAGAMVIGNGSVLSNPWASSLRTYRSSSPNMLLYWAMMEYGIQKRYKQFDLGRSTPGEGTYIFKEQWGANPETLYWYKISLSSDAKKFIDKQDDSDDGVGLMVKIWQRLPVSIASLMGPWIRKNISL